MGSKSAPSYARQLAENRYVPPELRPNGRQCKRCTADLYGGYWWYCPECWEDVRSESDLSGPDETWAGGAQGATWQIL